MKQFSKDLGNVCLAPKGKWSSEQEYERLALVYNGYNNLSYVAKINVPSGVDIENREYWQPMNATGYSDNNFINLTIENENGIITAYESIEEAIATIVPINRRVGATLSFYNLNSDRLDRQAEFELWQFNSTDLANWENKDYWNNIYYNWNVFAGWYIDADALNNHVNVPNVGQYAYVGSNLNDAILYQCRTNGTWTNTGIKVRNYISVVVSGNITIGENGNWFSNGEDTGIPATPAVDEQLDNIIMHLQQHTTEISNLKASDINLQNQITNNDNDIATLNTKHESLSRTVQGIAATGGASTATNVTYDKTNSGLNAENAQDAIDEEVARAKAAEEANAEAIEAVEQSIKGGDETTEIGDFPLSGHYKENGSMGGSFPAWQSCKIRIKRENAVITSTTKGNNINTFFLLLDKNEEIIYSQHSYNGVDRIFDLSPYKNAKFVCLSNYYNNGANIGKISITYPSIEGVYDKINKINKELSNNNDEINGLKNELDNSVNEISEIKGTLYGTEQHEEQPEYNLIGHYDKSLVFTEGNNWASLRQEINTDILSIRYKYSNTINHLCANGLYAENGGLILQTEPGEGEILLSDYPDAKYFYFTAVRSQGDYYVYITYKRTQGIVDRVSEIENRVEIEDEKSYEKDTKELKVLIIGDSISAGATCHALDSNFANYGNYDKWIENLIEWNFFDINNIKNNSLHASGFVAENPNSKLSFNGISYKNSFLDRTKYLVAKGAIDLSSFDLVIVFGGINDFKDITIEMGTSGSGDTTKIIPAMEEFYSYLIDNCIQARICTILPTRCSFGDTFRGVTIFEFSEAIKKVVGKYSLPLLDLTNRSGFYPFTAKFKAMWTRDFDGSGRGDGIHPNAEYYKRYLTPQIKSFIRSIL